MRKKLWRIIQLLYKVTKRLLQQLRHQGNILYLKYFYAAKPKPLLISFSLYKSKRHSVYSQIWCFYPDCDGDLFGSTSHTQVLRGRYTAHKPKQNYSFGYLPLGFSSSICFLNFFWTNILRNIQPLSINLKTTSSLFFITNKPSS